MSNVKLYQNKTYILINIPYILLYMVFKINLEIFQESLMSA